MTEYSDIISLNRKRTDKINNLQTKFIKVRLKTYFQNGETSPSWWFFTTIKYLNCFKEIF